MTAPLQVERVEELSLDAFERDTSRPLLFKGFVSKWPATARWQDLDYFKKIGGERRVPVRRMRNGEYLRGALEPMTLSSYLDTLAAPPVGDERIYLSETELQRILPEVLSDIETPKYITGDHKAMFYFGRDIFSQIHYHAFSKAVLCQVTGKKRVQLFAPDQSKKLYPEWNFSTTGAPPVDARRYPRYAEAVYSECLVEAGDMLYIPIYWWHGVHTIGPSASVTYFWDESPGKRWLAPRGIPKTEATLLQLARAFPVLTRLSKYGRRG